MRGRPRREPSARRGARAAGSGRGRPARRSRPAARPSGRSRRCRGRTMLNSFRQTVATPRKWPGRTRPRAPRSLVDVDPGAEAGRVELLRRGANSRSTPSSAAVAASASSSRGYAARSSRVVELRRVDEQADDDDVALRPRGAEEREVPAVEAPIVGTSADRDSPRAARAPRAARRPCAASSCARSSPRRARGTSGSSSGRWSRIASQVRVDRRPVAALDRPGQLEAVVDRPPHQRQERLGRRAGRLEERRGGAVERDEEARRERRRPRGRAASPRRRASNGSQAERPRQLDAATARASSVSAVTAAHAPSSCSGPRRA